MSTDRVGGRNDHRRRRENGHTPLPKPGTKDDVRTRRRSATAGISPIPVSLPCRRLGRGTASMTGQPATSSHSPRTPPAVAATGTPGSSSIHGRVSPTSPTEASSSTRSPITHHRHLSTPSAKPTPSPTSSSTPPPSPTDTDVADDVFEYEPRAPASPPLRRSGVVGERR